MKTTTSLVKVISRNDKDYELEAGFVLENRDTVYILSEPLNDKHYVLQSELRKSEMPRNQQRKDIITADKLYKALCSSVNVGTSPQVRLVMKRIEVAISANPRSSLIMLPKLNKFNESDTLKILFDATRPLAEVVAETQEQITVNCAAQAVLNCYPLDRMLLRFDVPKETQVAFYLFDKETNDLIQSATFEFRHRDFERKYPCRCLYRKLQSAVDSLLGVRRL